MFKIRATDSSLWGACRDWGVQEKGTYEGQSSVCGQRRSAARDARTGFGFKATRITRARMWGHAGNVPEMGSCWAGIQNKGQAQGRRVAAEAQLVGATRRDGRAGDECRLRVL